MENQVETIKYTPEKAKQNALAKLDLIVKLLINYKQIMILLNCIIHQIVICIRF